jgi:threonine dehydrogenase-like Zn-dependent dehydrogenase
MKEGATMKSLVVERGGKLQIKELPMPKIDSCQALVKVLSCGVCAGTDTKIIHGTFKNFDTYPAVLGHEAVGQVVEKGKDVVSYEIGDIVLLPYLWGEGDGVYYGWGAFSEYDVVGDWKAMELTGRGPGTPGFPEFCMAEQKLPKGFDPVDAAMIITFREVLSAMKRFGFKPNENIVIFGAGPVGLCFTKFAKLIGMGPVVSVDIMDEKAAEAKKAGADYAFNSTKVDIKAEVHKLFPGGADFVVDAVGINSLINQAMELIRYNGAICCYGISPKLDMQLDWSKAPYNWTLQFLQFPLKTEEAEAHTQIISWIEMGVLDPKDFISDVIPFSDILSAFKLVEERKALKKIVIKF